MSLRRVAIALVVVAVAGGLVYRFGRGLWHPVVVRIAGEATVSDRLAEIEVRHPDLAGMAFSDVAIIACKDPGWLEVYAAGRLWERFDLTAHSGGMGPKTREGDGQIPEGIYGIEALNPNSSYHLSLRVSYPNATDRARSAGLGVADPGGDIYIHGKAASIGCLAIGDRAVERVFYAVAKAGFERVRLVIAPTPAMPAHASTADRQLYGDIFAAMAEIRATASAGTPERALVP